MIKLPAAASFTLRVLPHVADEGDTAYFPTVNDGPLDHARQIAGYVLPKTTKLRNRTADTVTVD